jgi:hypothetical protein
MPNNASPEERLLKLIKGEDQKVERPAPLGQEIPEPKESLTVKPAAKRIVVPAIRLGVGPAQVKGILAGFAGLAILFLAASFIYPSIGLKKIKLPRASLKELSKSVSESKTEARPYEYYLKAVGNRQIFANAQAAQGEQPPAAADANVVKNINLVGIITGVNPQAVIEDRKTRQTFYLNKGQTINEFKIEDIQDGKVILNRNGQRFELYL